MVDQQYVLTLAAAPEGCFRGRVHGLAALPGNLGCAVRGMNDRWTAWFQRQGKDIKTRTLPVEESTTYAVLRDDEGQPLFIGHPIVADRPELVLNIARSEDGKRWLLVDEQSPDALTFADCWDRWVCAQPAVCNGGGWMIAGHHRVVGPPSCCNFDLATEEFVVTGPSHVGAEKPLGHRSSAAYEAQKSMDQDTLE